MLSLLLAADSYFPWLDSAIDTFARQFAPGTFLSLRSNITGVLAVLLVSVVCGAIGSLVVGNRMAFFSDALAHTAFAGIALGFLVARFVVGASTHRDISHWVTPVMAGFGVLVGLAIAFVREKTSLASDTVIGVFFAGAVGFGAMLLKGVNPSRFNPENFLFGDVGAVTADDLVLLVLLTLLTAGLLVWLYNQLVFTSFNTSLALSRRIPVRFCNYLFIVLLGLIVNLCLRTTGVLLINAMLIVPAATASNLSRNMRQLFWMTIALCLLVGLAGTWTSWSVWWEDQAGERISLGTGGTMVVLSVLLFFTSMLVRVARERYGQAMWERFCQRVGWRSA